MRGTRGDRRWRHARACYRLPVAWADSSGRVTCWLRCTYSPKTCVQQPGHVLAPLHLSFEWECFRHWPGRVLARPALGPVHALLLLCLMPLCGAQEGPDAG